MKHPLKMEFKYILVRKLPFVDLCILRVKMKTFLCEENVLCHYKRNCSPSYPDRYLSIDQSAHRF